MRGRLTEGRKKTLARSDQPTLGADAPPVIVGTISEPLPRRVVRGTISLVTTILLIAGLFYVVLSATVVGIFSAGPHNAVVLRGAFPEGSAPVGSLVYGSANEAAHDSAGRLRQAVMGVPAGSILQIISQPDHRIETDPTTGMIMSDGVPTGFTGQVAPRLLERSYLALCIAGGCGTPGDPVILPVGNVIGGVKAYIGWSGVNVLDAKTP